MNGSQHRGRKIIVGLVLLLALILPIAISLGYFQNTSETSTGNGQIPPTSSATPELAVETPRPPQPTKTVRKAEPAQGDNCTYPADYWLVATENWPEEITIGNLYYTQDQAIEFVTTQASDVFKILFIQLHAAYLNILSGASQSQIVEPMIEASDWLNMALYGSTTADYGLDRGLELARSIQAYNDGETGPGRCLAYSPPQRLFSHRINAAVLSLTPDISLLADQTDGSKGTPTSVIRTPLPGLPVSLATRTPTRKPDPAGTARPPTNTPTRQSTATQVPPTPRPTSPPPSDTPRPVEPTPTSAPPEDPTPTSPPP